MKKVDESPLVSVVMASYNAGDYLCQAVESLCRSTYTNIEIVVVDDGSTDDSARQLKERVSDARLKYVYQENQGQTRAKNRGIEESSGEFIAFCDADDMWEPNKLELQLPLFANPKVGVVYSDLSFVDEKGVSNKPETPREQFVGKVTNSLMVNNFVPFGTAVIRRACIECSGAFDEQYRMGIDWDLWLRYSLDWEFAAIPEQTYIYRVWSGQMSNNYVGRYDFAFTILANFVSKNAGVLDKSAVRKAWADTYIGKGFTFARNEKTIIYPLRNIVKGLCLDPGNIKGWKFLVKTILKRY